MRSRAGALRHGALLLALLLALAPAVVFAQAASLAAPADLTLSVEVNTLQASWTASTGADGYKVQWRVGSGSFGAANQATATDTTHTITGLTANTLYYVQVIAIRTGTTQSAPSAEQSATTELEPAAQPGGLSLSVVNSGTLGATWDTAARADGYKVQWRVGSGSFGATNQATATDTTHTITGLTANTLYYVQVIATRTGATDSAPSAEQSATTKVKPAAQPEGLSLSVVNSGTLGATWDTAARADGYKVQWRVGSGSFGAANEAATTDTTHTITGLSGNTLYYVQVIAIRTGTTQSAPSAEQSATTKVKPAAQPEGLSLSVVNSGTLGATWDTAARADGYKVQWRVASRSFGAANQATATDTTHDISNLAINTTYYVRVIATRTGAGDSQPSANQSAKITFTPTGVTVSGITSMTATVSAALSNPDAVQATVAFRYREDGSSDAWTTETSETSGATASVGLTGLDTNTTYEAQASVDDFASHQDTTFTTLVTDYYIDPDPGITTIRADDTWHAFSHGGLEELTVAVNAGQSTRYMAVSLSTLGSANCVQAINDSISVPVGETFYVTGCVAGESAIQLRDADGVPLTTYNVEVLEPAVGTIEAEDPVFVWRQHGSMHLPGEGLRLEMLNTLAGTYDDYSAYAYEARLEQPDALEGRVDILAGITRDGSEPPCALGAGTVVDASMTTTEVGRTGPLNPAGLAYSGSTLYLVTAGGSPSLYTVNTTTGAATLVGILGTGNPGGLADKNGTLYLVDGGTGSLYTVNTTTGAATLVGALGIGDPGDLAAIGTILYLVSYSTDNFYTVNTSTGAATLVGSLGISSSTLGEVNLSDAILGQITLAIYRTVTGGDDTLAHERTLTVYANDLVLTRPVAAWEINRMAHDEDNDASFRVPVEWRYLPGGAYEVPERARFLAWAANQPGTGTYVAPAPVETTGEIAAACVESAPPLVVENAVILKLGTGGTGPYSLEVCDIGYSANQPASVGLYYMRGDLYETNLIKKYVFLIPSDGSHLSPTPGENVQSSIGSFGTPTPQPTPDRAGLGGNYYTGARPNIIDADVEADDADPRVLDVTIFWEPLPASDGYMLRIDGVEQPDKAFSTNFRSEGFHLQEGENQRTVTFAVRGFKNGGIEGFTSAEGIFIPAHETYYSSWSRDFRVSLTEGGSGLDLGLTDDESAEGASVDLTARDIPKAGLITDAQDNVRELFSDITGLDTGSTAAKGLLPLMALVLGIAPALAIMLSMGFSPVSLMTGIGMFTLVWGVGGPLFLGVPIAMAAIFPILMLIAGFGVLKTKGVV